MASLCDGRANTTKVIFLEQHIKVFYMCILFILHLYIYNKNKLFNKDDLDLIDLVMSLHSNVEKFSFQKATSTITISLFICLEDLP